jgi:hypothetical protein
MFRSQFRTFRLIVAVGLSALMPAIAFAQNNGEEPATGLRVRGTVVNSVTHEPIGKALVYSTDRRFATMTDGEGHFEFSFPAASPEEQSAERRANSAGNSPNGGTVLTLNAKRPGFIQDVSSTVVRSRAGNRDVTLALTPEALITGRVTLPSSEPPSRIQLSLYRRQVSNGRAHWMFKGSVATRSNGEFRFANLPAGSYKLLTLELSENDPLTFDPRALDYEYPPVYFPNANNFVSAETIELSAGMTFRANLTVVRRAYYEVKIPVTNGPDHPIKVSVYAQGRGPGYALGYDPGEKTIMGTLPDGIYTVEAGDYGPWGAAGSVNITVKGAALEGPPLVMVASGTVRVEVKDELTAREEGNPAAGSIYRPVALGRGYLQCQLDPADDFSLERPAAGMNPKTGTEESLVLEHIIPGRYWVQVNARNGYIASLTSGGLDLLRKPLLVTAGSVPPIEITVRNDGAELDGSVEGLSKPGESKEAETERAPLDSPAHVYLIPSEQSNGIFRETVVSEEGKFNLQQVPPGDYLVLAFDQQQSQLEYTNAEAMRRYEAKGQKVHLVAGQKTRIQLQSISGGQ